jgi:hypothetical protein
LYDSDGSQNSASIKIPYSLPNLSRVAKAILYPLNEKNGIGDRFLLQQKLDSISTDFREVKLCLINIGSA